MPETPLELSWFAYGFFKRLRKDLPAREYEEFVKWWNSRISTGIHDSLPSRENLSD